MNFVYQNEATLREKNNFAIDISEKNNVEKEFFVGGNEYSLSSLELNLKEDDITKWEDYKKCHELSNLINVIKKEKLSDIDLNGYTTLLNNIKHKGKTFLFVNKPETVTYKLN